MNISLIYVLYSLNFTRLMALYTCSACHTQLNRMELLKGVIVLLNMVRSMLALANLRTLF